MPLKLQPHKPFGLLLRLDQATALEEEAYERDIPVSRLMREIITNYLLNKQNNEKQQSKN